MTLENQPLTYGQVAQVRENTGTLLHEASETGEHEIRAPDECRRQLQGPEPHHDERDRAIGQDRIERRGMHGLTRPG